MARLDEIKARLQAATPVDWVVEERGAAGRGNAWAITAEGYGTLATIRCYPGNGDDALLMAHAPADLAYLLAEIERLRDELHDARGGEPSNA